MTAKYSDGDLRPASAAILLENYQGGLARSKPSAPLAVATAAGFPILRMAVHATPRLAAGFASAPDLVGKFNATL